MREGSGEKESLSSKDPGTKSGWGAPLGGYLRTKRALCKFQLSLVISFHQVHRCAGSSFGELNRPDHDS